MSAKALKGPSLARSVPKPLKVPSLARSVPKPLKVPSLARSVPKPLKEPSLARSVLKPFKKEQEGEGEGAKRHYSLCHETLLLFAADLLPRWSSTLGVARRGSTLQKLIVGSEVRGTTPQS